MSPEFQQTLDNHNLVDAPIGKCKGKDGRWTGFIYTFLLDIAYGSKVFIRHVATRGGYLHSHPHNYPTGSKRK